MLTRFIINLLVRMTKGDGLVILLFPIAISILFLYFLSIKLKNPYVLAAVSGFFFGLASIFFSMYGLVSFFAETLFPVFMPVFWVFKNVSFYNMTLELVLNGILFAGIGLFIQYVAGRFMKDMKIANHVFIGISIVMVVGVMTEMLIRSFSSNQSVSLIEVLSNVMLLLFLIMIIIKIVIRKSSKIEEEQQVSENSKIQNEIEEHDETEHIGLTSRGSVIGIIGWIVSALLLPFVSYISIWLIDKEGYDFDIIPTFIIPTFIMLDLAVSAILWVPLSLIIVRIIKRRGEKAAILFAISGVFIYLVIIGGCIIMNFDEQIIMNFDEQIIMNPDEQIIMNPDEQIIIDIADPNKVIYFEDQVFEMAIRDCFSLDEGDITWKDIGYRTELDSDDFQPKNRISTLEDLKWFVNLQKIEMQKYEVEGDLSSFIHIENLKVLLMWETDVSGDISSLSGLENLRTINLNHTDVEGDISSLNTLVYLEELELKETDVEGDINSLNGLENLKFVELSGQSFHIFF